jgi:hypothetical protein
MPKHSAYKHTSHERTPHPYWPRTSCTTKPLIMQTVTSTQDLLESINPQLILNDGHLPTILDDSSLSAADVCAAIRQVTQTATPMAISFCMPLQNRPVNHSMHSGHVTPSAQSLRTHLNYLLAEMRVLSTLIAHSQKVTRLYWPAEMTGLLQPAEMTELMYHLHRSFCMARDDSAHYTFELAELPQDETLIPLIRGLGFTEVVLTDWRASLSDAPRIRLMDQAQLIRRYGFRSLGLRCYDTPLRLQRQVDQLLCLVRDLQPDTLYLTADEYSPGTRTDKLEAKHTALSHGLAKQGYHLTGKQRFQSARAPTWQEPRQLMGLGLGALSVIGNLVTRNVDQLDQYYQLLDQQQLPFSHGGYLQP